MKIYPKDNFEVEVSMSIGEILAVFDAEVDQKCFRWQSSGKKFKGEYSSNGFKIMRIISYRNSFLPVLEGKFRPSALGTLINVTMGLHRFVAAFMLLWFAGISAGFLTLLTAWLIGRLEPAPTGFIPLGMLLFGIVLVSGSFWWEAKKSKRLFIEMFSREKVSERHNQPEPSARLSFPYGSTSQKSYKK